MEAPAGSFYGGGYSMAPPYPLSGSAAMTPPSTPSAGVRSQNISLNQKMDLMLSMFTEQKKTVEDTKAFTDGFQKQIESLSADLAEVKNKVEAMSNSHCTKTSGRKKIPSQLSVSVKQLHDKAELQFRGKELYSSEHNQKAKDFLVCQLEMKFGEANSPKRIRSAVHRYYESRRRLFNDAQPNRVKRAQEVKARAKKNTRRKKLFERRKKFLKNKKERDMWSQIDVNFMTEESEDSDSIFQHSLEWRTDKLNKLVKKLDSRHKKTCKSSNFASKTKVASTASSLPAPTGPKWAVNPSFMLPPQSPPRLSLPSVNNCSPSGSSSDSDSSGDTTSEFED